MDKFEQEIAVLVDKWASEERELVPTFITKALIDGHIGGLARANEHTPFFEHYTHKGVRNDVGKYLAKKFGDTAGEGGKQLVLDGFEHLQRYYIIKRDGVEVPVLFEQITDEEFRAKAKMLRRRGAACYAHADEIERYIDLRKPAAAA